MCPNNFEASIVRFKLFSNIESNYSGKVSCEKVFISRLKRPIINLVQLFVSLLCELLSAPVDCVIGGDRVVDEFKE